MVAMTSWHSYPQIFNLGHKYIRDIFLDDVQIEEKIDGSQFSFGRFSWAESIGNIKCRSKGAQINSDYPEKMFKLAVDYVRSIADQLKEGWTYRGEFLAKPKHNTLAYDRIPNNHIIIFDINPAEETYLSYEEKVEEAKRIGLETVPLLYRGKIGGPDEILNLLDRSSVLGGQKIEGFVVKNYARFTVDKKAVMGKYVSEAFKEIHNGEWRAGNPGPHGILDLLIAKYRTPARWDKAIQHLRDDGKLEGTPRDIGLILRELGNDVEKECAEDIKQELFDWAWNKVRRALGSGFPDYYKEQLMRENFEPKEAVTNGLAN